jgi:flagellar motor switch protein FliN/FliY
MNTGTSWNDTGLDMESTPMNTKPDILTEEEKDALGEISNICMGTSATTLSTLLGKRVVITMPRVTISKGNEYLREYEKPVVATAVYYTQGLDGYNIFLLKKEDALLITNLLMGGEQSEEDLEEMYLSAVSEVMNQMVGASSTALANILNVQINISPPTTMEYSSEDEIVESAFPTGTLVRISFRMEIEGLLVSNIMQFMPLRFAKTLAESLLIGNEPEPEPPVDTRPKNEPASSQVQQDRAAHYASVYAEPQEQAKQPVKIRAARFQSFDEEEKEMGSTSQQNMDLIIDVPLNVTVVLGRAKKSIREILEMNLGSVIVLDRLAGEMVDVMVNGKMFARGEVVVIDDNYGVRITEVMTPSNVKM